MLVYQPKRTIAAAILGFILSIVSCQTLAADAGTGTTADTSTSGGTSGSSAGGEQIALLRQISENTYNILTAVNNLPTYLDQTLKLAISWLTMEDNPETSYIAKTQGNFATLGSLINQQIQQQNELQIQTMADVTAQPVADFTNPKDKPKILTAFPDINNLSYATLLGYPIVPKGTSSPYDYVRTVALSFPHTKPALLRGSPMDIVRYMNYYKTVMAIESFDGYILNDLVAQTQNGNQMSTAQQELISQASSSSWLAEIATEELGKVIRQLLLFESQSYVLLTQLVQTQKQLLTAQVMTNSLLIAVHQTDEKQLFENATNPPAS